MDRGEQKNPAQRLAQVEGLPQRRQERARSACLKALIPELHGFGIEELLIEARAPVLNQRDVSTVLGARLALPKGSRFHVEHLPGSADPLLWAADVVAGAVRASRQGDPVHLTLLSERVYLLEVDTSC